MLLTLADTGHACYSAALCQLATLLAEAANLSQHLRAALAYACRCEPPVRQISELARWTACDRCTLWREWHDAVRGAPCPRLEDFLSWVLLLRALTEKTPKRSWVVVADTLHVHEHTLRRVARRLTNRSLRELEAGEPASILPLFMNDVIRPLAGERWDPLG